MVFYMYDDRGCLVNSNKNDQLVHLYHKYNQWLVDYWREDFDRMFK